MYYTLELYPRDYIIELNTLHWTFGVESDFIALENLSNLGNFDK